MSDAPADVKPETDTKVRVCTCLLACVYMFAHALTHVRARIRARV